MTHPLAPFVRAVLEKAAEVAYAQEAKAHKTANEADDETQTDWDGGVLFGTEIGARMIAAAIRVIDADQIAADLAHLVPGVGEVERLREAVKALEWFAEIPADAAISAMQRAFPAAIQETHHDR